MLRVSRRKVLASAAAMAASTMLESSAKAMPQSLMRLPPGVQLWTVRDELTKDFAGTLRALKRIGYARVEAAGWANQAPRDFRQGVADAGLSCISCHFSMADILADTDARLSEAKAAGVEYLVVSAPAPLRAVPPGLSFSHGLAQAMTLDDWHRHAGLLNTIGAKALALGLRVAYHNHPVEFLNYEGKLAWTELLRLTDPRLVAFEVDLGWAAAAGLDPAYVLQLGGRRVELLHLKDLVTSQRNPFTLADDRSTTGLGKGTIDWKEALAAARMNCAVRGWFVEQEAPYIEPPLTSLAESLTYLKSLES